MENPSGSERSRAGIEDNMLAMFDASETKDAHQDALDDRTNHTSLFFFKKIILYLVFFLFSLDTPMRSCPQRRSLCLG